MNMEKLTVIAAAALVAFLITALSGRAVIPFLHRMNFGQSIRAEGPSWHRKKQGTPTMGGLMFIGATVLTLAIAIVACETILPVKFFDRSPLSSVVMTRLFGGLLMALCSGAIGFADDYISIVKKRNLGLTARQKMFGQLLVALGYAMSLYMAHSTSLHIPFVGSVNLGLWFIPFCMFVNVSMVNAVNLTDGIDGLCGTVSFIVSLFFIVAAGKITGYFTQSLLASILAGALAGFLVWNLHPAKVFMGDTGSLFLGGMITAFAFGINRPLLLIPVGIIYITEVLSVVLQVSYFKMTHGKRLFKMSPIHHHFEMSGWNENKIVSVFSGITLLGCGVAWLFLVFA